MSSSQSTAPRQLYAEFIALQGSEARVAELAVGLVADVRAEPGCLRFDAFTRQDDPRHWVVFERYESEEAFEAHIASDHSQQFNIEIAPHIVGGESTLIWLSER